MKVVMIIVAAFGFFAYDISYNNGQMIYWIKSILLPN